MAKGKGKKKTGLIIGLILGILLLGGGAVVGLAMTGKINIPGLTPKKKPAPAKDAKKEKPKPKVVVPPKKVEAPVEEAPIMLTQQGAAKIGEVWNEMSTDKLAKLVGKWKPNELAVVLNEMDTAKVADLLSEMQPETASLISKEMKRLASIPAVE